MPRPKKMPAFPFYGNDAYSDEAFNRLSSEAQGVWFWLAWWQWLECSIPADLDDILDRAPRRKVSEYRRAWKELEAFFPVMGDNPRRRQSPSVEKQYAILTGARKKNAEGAERTNELRRQRTVFPVNGTLTVPDTVTLRAEDEGEVERKSSPVEIKNEPVGVQGEGSPSPEIRAAITAVQAAFLPDLRPPDGKAWALLTALGGDVAGVVEIIRRYPTKPVMYIAKAVETEARERRAPVTARPDTIRIEKPASVAAVAMPEPNPWSELVATLPQPCDALRASRLVAVAGDTWDVGVRSAADIDAIRDGHATQIRARIGSDRHVHFVVVNEWVKESA